MANPAARKWSGKAHSVGNQTLTTLPHAQTRLCDRRCMRCFVQWVHTDCLRKRAFPVTTRIEVLEDSKRLHIWPFLTRCPRGHNRNGVGSGPEHAGLIFMMSWLSTMQKTAQFERKMVHNRTESDLPPISLCCQLPPSRISGHDSPL